MRDNFYHIWSWNQEKMQTITQLLLFTLVTELVYHKTDAIFCPDVCWCDNANAQCRQVNLTYIPHTLYRFTISLDVSENKIFSLPNTSFRNVPNLENLQLEFNRIAHIELGAFSSLLNLRILNLKGNRIGSFPRDLFSSNRKLERLDLSQNTLYYLPHEAINHLFNLQVLNVSHNHISSAHLGHNFRDTVHLEHLDLSFNNIPQIERDTFVSMAWWEIDRPHHLNLSNCNIRTIQRDAFKDLNPLTSLELSDNDKLSMQSLVISMRDVPTRNLKSLKLANLSISNLGNIFINGKFNSLLELDLSRNSLERIISGSLYALEDLQILDLSQNSISHIQSFNGLNNLKVLKLSNNRLEQLNFSFDGLQTLQELHLANNMLTRLSSEPFEDLWDLEVLDITNNFVSTVNIKFGFENIRYLYFAHNQLTDIDFLPTLPHVKILDASFNRIAILRTQVFSRAQMLQAVNLSHNYITQIEPKTFALPTLEELDLSYNRLEQLTHYGWKSPLKELYFHHNNITYIAPNSLHRVNSLELLDISNCGLYGFPLNTFSDLRLLTTLDISHNNLGLFLSLPKAQSVFQGMESLKFINVSNCELIVFPIFNATSRKTLQTMDLCWNEISKLPKDSLHGFVALNSLNLAHNQISTVDTKVFSDLISLQNIDMSQNPFSCSCDLKPLCDWSTSTEVNIHGFHSSNNAYSCHAQGGETFELSEFCTAVIPQKCDTKTLFWIILASVVLVTFLIMAVLIYKYCHRKRKRKSKKSQESQNMALQISCKGETEKMMPDTCRYICDESYKEDML